MNKRMQEPAQTERPYRSHLRPACEPCRSRKSRCMTEIGERSCIMCRAHHTVCVFGHGVGWSPAMFERHQGRGDTASNELRNGARGPRRRPRPVQSSRGSRTSKRSNRGETGRDRDTALGQDTTKSPPRRQSPEDASLTLTPADDQHLNMHIVGPVATNDSQVLADYLSGIPGATRSTRMMMQEPASRSGPVLFTMVQKRPVGVTVKSSPSAEKLEVIEKLLEPHAEELIDEYFEKVNICLPLLDEASFRRQFHEKKDRISPALLACLYASSLVYWKYSPTLKHHRCPDSRFIWNLASEAVYSELLLSPGVSIISAILLNIAGRPTTSLVGNGVLLGSAVSVAHSLGLNRSPLPWRIALPEKCLRMKIWWSLLLHDRWTSLAHGTPPRISRDQYDVPHPKLEHLIEEGASDRVTNAASVFIALMGLTDVLNQLLQHVHHVGKDKVQDIDSLELHLNTWVDSLDETCRRLILLRDSCLDVPGASNLRLAYLTTRLLLQRINIEAEKQTPNPNSNRLANHHIQARQTAEQILLFTQELQPAHLADFWLSVSAFAFPTAVNYLLRCALETETSPAGLARSRSFEVARDLVGALGRLRDGFGWDLADICVEQHAEVVEKVLARARIGVEMGEGIEDGDTNGNVDEGRDEDGGRGFDLQGLFSDASLLDHFFPHAWDPLQGAW